MSPLDIAEFTKWLATLGVGGALAAFIFVFYRKDMIADKERMQDVIKRWEVQSQRWDNQAGVWMQVVKDNTESNTKLVGAVESLQRQLDKSR